MKIKIWCHWGQMRYEEKIEVDDDEISDLDEDALQEYIHENLVQDVINNSGFEASWDEVE